MVYALQKVQIRNNIPLAEAEKHYKNITKKKPRKVRETENFYQFRYLPPTKFEKRSFRTKVVNDDIHLIFGKLKEEHRHLEGRGLWDYFTKGYDYVANKVSGAFDYVKNSLSITDFSTKTKANLDKYGDEPITAIQLRRVPVAYALELTLQGVSGGEWERLKEREGFDKFFHLSMVVTLRSGKRLAVEKLEVVSVNENIEVADGMETQDVPIPADHPTITINGMFRKTRERVGDTKFFSYSALGHNNCQDFMDMLLTSEGLYREAERLFVYQDISSIARDLPELTRAFSQGVTYLGALANKFLGIGGNRVTLDHLTGGNQSAGFIRALMARDSANPAERDAYVAEKTGQTNAEKFKKVDEEGFKMQEMTKTTHDVARKKKALTRDERVKRFYDYVIANAPAHQPQSANGVNYAKTYDLDRLYDQWIESERDPRQELARRYDTIEKANGLGKDQARAVFRQLGGNPRVEGNNKAYRPAREVAQLIVQYANRILANY